ncbi:PorT family protein [Subsaximicrobium wynnwilliamsii]|uniref:PorT family protein n=1 Tax=Subsaximicrobium wynnwilliamsii TaxID=291179 RepID=A0A5C6ZA63_9FLAO|nr:outer membrane beta-barrel protein [Subsaximicrobium wynnwilliamsii]TXD80682.1 PorT family protein [Subsaximicrobium wynnwilliamsii]TXD86424.1 PorT family protein [Subsaximicrobium wynnwilliamsii]TXD99893.1 PorT family protein [Subsaximicrobium wynnwilliamsii]
MKRLLFYTISFLCFYTSNAQKNFGVFAGINHINLTDANNFPTQGSSNGIGLNFGLSYDIEISEKVIFSPRIVYSQQGTTKSRAEDVNDVDDFVTAVYFQYKLNYLNFPMQFKIFRQPYILAGPYAGFVLYEERYNLDFGDIESKIDYGINLGIGYNFKNLFTELNVQQGFASLVVVENTPNSDEFKLNNTIIQLSVGYKFN